MTTSRRRANTESGRLWPRVCETDGSSTLSSVGITLATPLLAPTWVVPALDPHSLSSRHAKKHAVRVAGAGREPARAEGASPGHRGLDLDAWLGHQKKALVAAIKDGPVLVS